MRMGLGLGLTAARSAGGSAQQAALRERMAIATDYVISGDGFVFRVVHGGSVGMDSLDETRRHRGSRVTNSNSVEVNFMVMA